jgi:hypothetical protein
MKASRNSDFQALKEAAIAQGWKVELTGKSHWCFTPPDPTKPKAYTGSTPSDKRSLLNFRRDLRQRGLRV